MASAGSTRWHSNMREYREIEAGLGEVVDRRHLERHVAKPLRRRLLHREAEHRRVEIDADRTTGRHPRPREFQGDMPTSAAQVDATWARAATPSRSSERVRGGSWTLASRFILSRTPRPRSIVYSLTAHPLSNYETRGRRRTHDAQASVSLRAQQFCATTAAGLPRFQMRHLSGG